jgi:hypothetical protein
MLPAPLSIFDSAVGPEIRQVVIPFCAILSQHYDPFDRGALGSPRILRSFRRVIPSPQGYYKHLPAFHSSDG